MFMRTKICQVCKTEKSIVQFYKHSARKDGLRANCIDCGRKSSNEFYHKNPEPYKRRAKKFRKILKEKRKIWVNNIKVLYGCQLCGERDLEVLDFHHVDESKKDFNITSSKTIKLLTEEINKCVVLCANDHRRVHSKTKYINSSMLCNVIGPKRSKLNEPYEFPKICISISNNHPIQRPAS